MEKKRKAAELVTKLGLQFGLVFIIFNLIKFQFKLETQSVGTSTLLWFIGLGIYIGMEVFVIKRIRDHIMDGYINYLNALSYALSTIFIAAFMSSIVSFVYFQWIDPFFLSIRANGIKELSLNYLAAANADSEILDTFRGMFEEAGIPKAFDGAKAQLVSNIALSFIVGLITALYMRRNEPQH